MNNSKLYKTLIKWYYGELDILVALVDKPGKSYNFPNGTVNWFYTPKLQAEKDNFADYLTQINTDFEYI